METENDLAKYLALAQSLEEVVGDRPGLDYVKWIIDDLRKGDIDAAKANYRNQSDKFDRLPEIKQLLKEAGIVEEIDWSKYNSD